MTAAEHKSALAAAERDHSFVLASNAFLKKVLGGTVLIIGLSVAVNVTLAVLLANANDPVVIASTPDGRVLEATRLDEPMMGDDAFRQSVALALVKTFTFGFHDYDMRLAAVREYFSDDGYESLREQLRVSGALDRIIEENQTVSLVLQSTPKITSRTIYEGTQYVAVEVDVLVSFRASGSHGHSDHYTITALTRRAPYTESVRGWVIAQILMTET